ncbi:MAG: GNAT family N-acetyltransferase [Salinarimonas sp.]|nr:GNAT family N-acetyltransferase [Salinarimonas sp.]
MTYDLPTFQTKHLIVKPRTLLDLQACLAMDRDPEVTRYIPGPWADPDRHEAFVRARIKTDFGPGLGYWSVVPRERPDCFLGWILLIPYEGIGPEIDIGWRFVREAWGNGYAGEATAPVLAHAFQTVGLERVVADIDDRNARSIKVATRIGMADQGRIEKGGITYRSFVLAAQDHMQGSAGRLPPR